MVDLNPETFTQKTYEINVNNYTILQHQAIPTSDMMYIESKFVLNKTGIFIFVHHQLVI